jgi:putative membrane protein
VVRTAIYGFGSGNDSRVSHLMLRGTVVMSVPASYSRVPLVLLSIVVLVCVATAINPPAGRVNWLLEVGPGLAGIAVLIAIYRRFPMSHMVYYFVFLHMFVLIYGG